MARRITVFAQVTFATTSKEPTKELAEKYFDDLVTNIYDLLSPEWFDIDESGWMLDDIKYSEAEEWLNQ
jgi:hypothetical protein